MMNPVSNSSAVSVHTTQGRQAFGQRTPLPPPSPEAVAEAEKLRDAYARFVGVTFFGKALSSMRQSLGEPAYFHGGQAEKMFQSQLDQQLVEGMSKRSGSSFSDQLFEHQFRDEADVLRRAEAAEKASSLDQLSNLPRR